MGDISEDLQALGAERQGTVEAPKRTKGPTDQSSNKGASGEPPASEPANQPEG
jgi:hypothetical protein